MPRSQHRALLLLAFAVCAAVSVEPVEAYEEDGACRANDTASLIQVKRNAGARSSMSAIHAAVSESASQPSCLAGSSMENGIPGVNKGKPTRCDSSPKGCCPLFGYTYPCPSRSKEEQQAANCVLDHPPAGLFPPFVQAEPVSPPDSQFDGDSYGSVVLPGDEPLVEFLRKVPGVERSRIIPKTCPEYKNAFYPGVDGYQYLWGDLGSEVNPGFGGVRNYNVVEVTPDNRTGLSLYHMTAYRSCEQCDIWWGFKSSYEVPFVNASINVQTCLPWEALVRCKLTKPFLAVIGPGWDRDENGFLTMGCNKTVMPASTLVNLSYPGAPPNVMQVVLPSCDVAESCDVVNFPPPEKLNDPEQVPSLAALFDEDPDSVHPPRPEPCKRRAGGAEIGTKAGRAHR